MKNVKKYKMTVIIPSYNNGKYIIDALNSILAQKVDFSYQIIVTDDHSQDNSRQIIEDYVQKYPDRMLALFSDVNCRLFINVLKALKIMDSEYFCVLDPDDYYVDEYFWKNAIDFLEQHTDYTIYASNIEYLYNDGLTKLKYDYQDLISKTSTYEDFLSGKAILSCTPPSVFRNVYFENGVPDEYDNIKNTIFMEAFRADTARNLIHLKRGKAYFENKITSVCRYHGKGLSSGLREYQKYILSAFGMIGFYEFFGYENTEEYGRIIEKGYKSAIKAYYQDTISEKEVVLLPEEMQKKFDFVSKWLNAEKIKFCDRHVKFDLRKYKKIYTECVAIWGTGSATKKIINEYGIVLKHNSFFIDNSAEKQGTLFMGHKVYAPTELLKHHGITVVLTSSFHEEIIEQIISDNLCELDNILDLYDYREYWVG